MGYEKNCKKRIENFKDTDEGIEFSLEGNNYKINLNGKHNCINGAMAVVVGMSLDLTSEEIQKGFDNLNLTPMRFQKIVKGETLYINDAYNASPISMRYSLETFDKLYNDRTKIAVLGDMLELGDKEIEFHREIIKKALDIKVDRENIYSIVGDIEIIVEAFDRAETKAMTLEELLTDKNKIVVSASGMAGLGSANEIVTRKINFYLIGDNYSDYEEYSGIMSTRVMICAAHQANMVLRLILEEKGE